MSASRKLSWGVLGGALIAISTFACGKSKARPIAHCVAVLIAAEDSVSGRPQTLTSCLPSSTECERLKEELVVGSAGRCVPTSRLWCIGEQWCAPTEKRCELNQQALAGVAAADGSAQEVAACVQSVTLPAFELRALDVPQPPDQESRGGVQ